MGTEGARALLERAGTLTLQTGNLLNWGCLRKKCPATPGEEVRGGPALPFGALGRGQPWGERPGPGRGRWRLRERWVPFPGGPSASGAGPVPAAHGWPGARHGEERLWLPSHPLAGALGRREIGMAEQFCLFVFVRSLCPALLGGRGPRKHLALRRSEPSLVIPGVKD